MNIWEILEIPATTDVIKIKKAFSLQSSKYHPEEYPNEFHALYLAYKKALNYARHDSDESIQPDSQLVYKENVVVQSSQNAIDVSDQEKWTLVDHYNSDRRKQIAIVMEDLKSILDSKESSETDLLRIFKSCEFSEVKSEEELLQYLVTQLHMRKITSWNTGLLLWQTYQLDRFSCNDDKGIYSELYEILDYIKTKWQRSEEKVPKRSTSDLEIPKISRKTWVIIGFIIFCIKKLVS